MKKIIVLIALMTLAGCVPQQQFMQDMEENQYFEKTTYGDQNAPYIGEWTAATGPGLTSLKINKSGDVKICSSLSHFGNSNGKVFKEAGKIKMIFESGFQEEIISSYHFYLIIQSCDKEYKYYSGKVSENCKSVFAKFK